MDNFPIFNDFSPHLFPQEPLNWTKFFFSIKKKKKLNGCASRGLAVFSRASNNVFRSIYSNISLHTFHRNRLHTPTALWCGTVPWWEHTGNFNISQITYDSPIFCVKGHLPAKE